MIRRRLFPDRYSCEALALALSCETQPAADLAFEAFAAADRGDLERGRLLTEAAIKAHVDRARELREGGWTLDCECAGASIMRTRHAWRVWDREELAREIAPWPC